MAQPTTPRFPDRASSVTPDDNAVFNPSTIYVGGAGDVAVVPVANNDGDSVVFSGLIAGSVVPIRVKQVLATGTTATNLVRVS